MNNILDGAKGGNRRVSNNDNLEEGKTSAINNQLSRQNSILRASDIFIEKEQSP